MLSRMSNFCFNNMMTVKGQQKDKVATNKQLESDMSAHGTHGQHTCYMHAKLITYNQRFGLSSRLPLDL